MLRTSFLKIGAAQFAARNLCCDRDHGNPAALAIVKSVDKVEVARAATPGAHREASGQMGFRPGGESCRLLVPHMDPLDILPLANRVGDTVKRVTRNSIDPANTSFSQDLGYEIRYSVFRHFVKHSFLDSRDIHQSQKQLPCQEIARTSHIESAPSRCSCL